MTTERLPADAIDRDMALSEMYTDLLTRAGWEVKGSLDVDPDEEGCYADFSRANPDTENYDMDELAQRLARLPGSENQLCQSNDDGSYYFGRADIDSIHLNSPAKKGMISSILGIKVFDYDVRYHHGYFGLFGVQAIETLIEYGNEIKASEADKEQVQQDTAERIVLQDDLDTVSLRQLIPEDAEAYFQLVENGRDHLSQHRDTTAAKYPDVQSVLKSIVDPVSSSRYRFGIWDGDLMVGTNNLTVYGGDRGELGTWISEPYIGNEYAGRGRRLLVDFAFKTLGLKKVYCDISVGNEASRRSVEKSNFQFIGEHDDENGNLYWRYEMYRS